MEGEGDDNAGGVSAGRETERGRWRRLVARLVEKGRGAGEVTRDEDEEGGEVWGGADPGGKGRRETITEKHGAMSYPMCTAELTGGRQLERGEDARGERRGWGWSCITGWMREVRRRGVGWASAESRTGQDTKSLRGAAGPLVS